MERLTAKKKLAIIRLYLSGLSYDEIAARCVWPAAWPDLAAVLRGFYPQLTNIANNKSRGN